MPTVASSWMSDLRWMRGLFLGRLASGLLAATMGCQAGYEVLEVNAADEAMGGTVSQLSDSWHKLIKAITLKYGKQNAKCWFLTSPDRIRILITK